MARGINVLLTLIDKFSEPMKKAAGETKKATRQIRNAQNMVNKFAGDANQKFLSLAGKDRIGHCGSWGWPGCSWHQELCG